MTTRPYELLARFALDGTVAGVSVRTITTVNGRDYESDPQPLSGTGDAAFAAFSDQFAAAVVAERDTLSAQVTTLAAEKETLLARVAELEAELASGVDENGVPTVITPLQGRIALKRANLLDAVEAAIVQANGETQIWWEYSTLWHRTHPVLNALGTSLGLSSEQIDDLFRVAGAIE
jgi:hypothetical protein